MYFTCKFDGFTQDYGAKAEKQIMCMLQNINIVYCNVQYIVRGSTVSQRIVVKAGAAKFLSRSLCRLYKGS
jgi:hypothetical protein